MSNVYVTTKTGYQETIEFKNGGQIETQSSQRKIK